MDFADNASQQEELMREVALRRAANHAPDLPSVGVCYWCNEEVEPPRRFCNVECRDQFEIRQRTDAINGRC